MIATTHSEQSKETETVITMVKPTLSFDTKLTNICFPSEHLAYFSIWDRRNGL